MDARTGGRPARSFASTSFFLRSFDLRAPEPSKTRAFRGHRAKVQRATAIPKKDL